MREQFLRKLNYELKPLKGGERKKHINNYEEILLDKMESGMTEEDAVIDLGNVKQIAKEILNSYVELDEMEINVNQSYFNKIYMLFDGIVLVISYVFAYYLCFKSAFFNIDSEPLSFMVYMSALIYIIPCYLILCYLFKLYTVRCTKEKFCEVRNIFFANVIGLIIFTFILYLTKQFNFSRIMVSTFVCVNIILEILSRNFIFYHFGNFYKTK